jgi:hypothetical protein
LLNANGDTMASVYIFNESGSDIRIPSIIVDISGRHYNCDDEVKRLLTIIQGKVGGIMECSQ